MSGDDKVVHLDDRRPRPSTEAELEEWRSLAKHFHEQNAALLGQIQKLGAQNETLAAQNREHSGKVDRLVRGVEMLVGEMHAFRTGEKDAAFARIARPDEEADLLRTEANVALYYPYSGAEIGKLLGFTAAQVGMLLGSHGLGWAGDGDHQEMTRWKEGRTRFWHKDVPTKLAEVLLNREPEAFRITSKQVRSMFAAFKARPQAARRG